MGISANQARLMALTARQHDLELRAQQISATKMVLSLQSQKEATDYSTALNIYSLLNTVESQWKSASTKYFIDDNGNVTVDETNGTEYASASLLVAAVASKLKIQDSSSSVTSANVYLEKAKSAYDLATTELSTKEKMWDMELTQINTEHSAVKTEYDAIKSLIGDNVDKSFNVFG